MSEIETFKYFVLFIIVMASKLDKARFMSALARSKGNWGEKYDRTEHFKRFQNITKPCVLCGFWYSKKNLHKPLQHKCCRFF